MIFLTTALAVCSFQIKEVKEYFELKYPKSWPEPVYNFSDNHLTDEKIQLGRKLFYDPSLSRDKTISCSSCHLQFVGFTHIDHKLSHGIEGRKGTRNSPVLINLAWNSSFHWDGGVNNLEVQPINPIQHPLEMDNSLDSVLSYLNNDAEYLKRFKKAFGDSAVNSKNMLKALAQFTVSLVSSDSKFDKYMSNEVEFSQQEKNGYKLFNKHCNSCHTAPLFNSNKYASNGLPVDTALNDVGRFAITHIPADSFQFRIPTLRNIQFSTPYMHDGRFKKLKDVIDYYCDEIDKNTPYLSDGLKRKITLTENDKKDLIAFLYTLSDKKFLYNPNFQYPR